MKISEMRKIYFVQVDQKFSDRISCWKACRFDENEEGVKENHVMISSGNASNQAKRKIWLDRDFPFIRKTSLWISESKLLSVVEFLNQVLILLWKATLKFEMMTKWCNITRKACNAQKLVLFLQQIKTCRSKFKHACFKHFFHKLQESYFRQRRTCEKFIQKLEFIVGKHATELLKSHGKTKDSIRFFKSRKSLEDYYKEFGSNLNNLFDVIKTMINRRVSSFLKNLRSFPKQEKSAEVLYMPNLQNMSHQEKNRFIKPFPLNLFFFLRSDWKKKTRFFSCFIKLKQASRLDFEKLVSMGCNHFVLFNDENQTKDLTCKAEKEIIDVHQMMCTTHQNDLKKLASEYKDLVKDVEHSRSRGYARHLQALFKANAFATKKLLEVKTKNLSKLPKSVHTRLVSSQHLSDSELLSILEFMVGGTKSCLHQEVQGLCLIANDMYGIVTVLIFLLIHKLTKKTEAEILDYMEAVFSFLEQAYCCLPKNISLRQQLRRLKSEVRSSVNELSVSL